MKKTTDPTDTAIDTWRTALTARADASKAHADAHREAEAKRRPGYNMTPEARLDVLALQSAALTSEDEETAARARAVAVQAARDVANGDPDAIGCDLARLHGEVVEGIAEIERRRAELADFERGLVARVDAARASHAALAIRRAAANLPEPARVPTAPGFGELVALLETRIEETSTPAPKNGEKIRALKREATDLRVALETAHREKEAAKARAEADAEQEEQNRKDREKANALENEALRAKYAAEAKAREDMANAHRARTA